MNDEVQEAVKLASRIPAEDLPWVIGYLSVQAADQVIRACEALERTRIKVGDPARFRLNGKPSCKASAEAGFHCTESEGHLPPHIASGLEQVWAVWE